MILDLSLNLVVRWFLRVYLNGGYAKYNETILKGLLWILLVMCTPVYISNEVTSTAPALWFPFTKSEADKQSAEKKVETDSD